MPHGPGTVSFYAATYLDDVIIHSKSWAEHIQHVTVGLESLKLTTNLTKCAVGQREVWLLGYHLGSRQVQPQVDKTAAIATCPKPNTSVDQPLLHISWKLSERVKTLQPFKFEMVRRPGVQVAVDALSRSVKGHCSYS